MEKDFFELYQAREKLSVVVGHNSVADWTITVCDRRAKPLSDVPEPVVQVQESTRELAFAKAYVALAEHFLTTYGGY